MIESSAQYVLFAALAMLPVALLLRFFGQRNTGPPHLVALVLLGQGMVLAAPLFTGGSVGVPLGGALAVSQLGWLAIVGSLAMGLLMVRPRGNTGRPARTVRLALLAMIGSQLLSGFASGQVPSLNVLLPSVLVAVILTRFSMPSPEEAIRVSQWAVMIPVTASVAAFALGFEWAVFPDGRRLPNPFMDSRLTGVLPHPNGLGPIAAVAVLLSVSRWSRRQVLPLLIATFALWGSDTRTMILVTPIALMPIISHRLDLPATLRAAAVAASAGILLLTTWFWLQDVGGTPNEIGTVNGRTVVWQRAYDYLRENTLLGAGHRAFDQDFIQSSGLAYAGQAHNQVFQTMAANGLIGLVPLGCLLVVLGRLAISSSDRTSGLSASLAIIGIAYLMVESPLRLSRWTPGLFVVSVVLTVCLSGHGQTKPSSSVHQRGAVSA